MNRKRIMRAMEHHYPVMDSNDVYALDVLKEAAQELLNREGTKLFRPHSTCGVCYGDIVRRWTRWRHVRRGSYGHDPKPEHKLTDVERKRLGWD